MLNETMQDDRILVQGRRKRNQTYNSSGGDMSCDVSLLTKLINDEVIRAMGLRSDGWAGQHLQPILSRATRRFSEIFVTADSVIAEEGLVAGARSVLRDLVSDFLVRGTQNIPHSGPVVIASNHPGTVDSVTIVASAGREDMKIVASAVPFLQNLTHVAEHLIFLPRQGIQARMLAVRKGIHHLQQGGALLLFARGNIDPDPSFMAEAETERELAAWSRSLDIFLSRVPQSQVVASIVSHVLVPAYMHHPLTWFQRGRCDRQRLAMMIQIIQQMLGKKLDIVPHVSFGQAVSWTSSGIQRQSREKIVEAARHLLKSHLAWQT
jgi:hypothetical protein